MIVVSGKTYPVREQIKALGGKWNSTAMNWTFETLDPEAITLLRAIDGVVVTDTNATKAPERKPSTETADGKTVLYGEDHTYLNQFIDKDPITFAGFSSLDEMLNFIETIPSSISADYKYSRNYAWESGSWSGTNSMSEALSLCRNGWVKGSNMAREALEIITGDHYAKRQRQYAVAGGRANVGRMLSGNPLHMINRTRRDSKKVITLFVEMVMSGSIKADNAIVRAACIAAISDVLENSGYSCEIIGVNSSRMYQGTVILKAAGEPMNIDNLTFALGHPSMLRRFWFAVAAVNPAMRPHWGSMGKTSIAFNNDHPTELGTFYIDKLSMQDESKVRGKTFAERVRSLFPLIVPDNFPVSLKE